MQEGRYKVLMYVFLGLFIIAVGFGGYFGLFYYNYQKLVKSVNNNSAETPDPVKEIQELSRMGNIKEVNETSITITNEQQQDEKYDLSSETVIQKMAENKDSPGTFLFVDATKSDLANGQLVWIIVDKTNNNLVNTIKISN